MGLLENKKVIVTGGSLGIGLEVARQCAEEGAQLFLISRHEENLKKAITTISTNKHNHTYFCLDVSLPEKVKETTVEIEKNYGRVDGLVNCAGIYGPIGKLDDIDPLHFKYAIETNLLGTFYMCHYFIPLLRKAKRGKIINFSGGGAAGPFPCFSAYATSKIGVVRLTENLSREFENDNIDVNAVAPGFVVTRLHQETVKAGDRAGKQFFDKTLQQIKEGGVPPEKAAKLTVFLLSSDSDGISGKFISAPWDPWEDKNYLLNIRKDKDLATLRRIDNKYFMKKEQD